jgi:hypothetical protein
VRREYELDAEVGEAWLAGCRASTSMSRRAPGGDLGPIRITARARRAEPARQPGTGRVDLEDIRRPVSMLNVKGYAGDGRPR